MSADTIDVVIADDSALYRQLLSNALGHIPGVRVVGAVGDGLAALDLVTRLRPHVLTLDMEMPGLDGVGVLAELRRRGARTRVIVVSNLVPDGAPVTIEAILQGAFDVVLKPAAVDPHEARAIIARSLAEKLLLVRRHLVFSSGAAAAPPVPRAPVACGRAVLAVGGSTGGPEGLRQLLPLLPATLPVPVFIVQHILAPFSPVLAARLRELASLPLTEAETGLPVEPGRIYLAPAGRNLVVERTAGGVCCRLDDGAVQSGCRPSFDRLLESACEAYSGRVVAAVLSGMGSDGLAGCRAVKARGGYVVAQHRDSCAVWGMPKAVEMQGLADAIPPPGDIAAAVLAGVSRMVGTP